MTDWTNWKLRDLVGEAGGVIRTGPFGSQLHADEYTKDSNGVPVIMPKDMVDGRVDHASVKRVNQAVAERLREHRLSKGDIVLARRGDLGRFAYIDDDDIGSLCGTGSIRIHAPKSQTVTPEFLRYSISHPNVSNWLMAHAVGSTLPNLNAPTVENLPLCIPDLETQRGVALVLSAFDELIKLNERQAVLLEAIALSLYREWFVRFRFPGHGDVKLVDSDSGPIPKGWDLRRLGEVADLHYGKALPARKRQPGRVPVISSAGVIDTHDEALVDGPGIVLGRKGNVGSVWWSHEPFFPIDTTYYVTSDHPLGFLYWKLRELAFIDSHAAVPGLSRNQADALPILCPPHNLSREFDRVHTKLFALTFTQRTRTRALAATRDLLLPRLVTGKLDIAGLDLDSLLSATETA